MGIRSGHLTATPIASANWSTGSSYAVGDVVVNSLDMYVCLTAHTSGTFTTDLAAQKWQKLNQSVVEENVVLNPSPRVNVEGYTVFQDADQVNPVDGIGGTPTITWTRTTSSPLSDTGSFLLTKGSGSARGQGVSTDFKIKKARRGKKMRIAFDYEVVSGTFSTGDVSVWVLDTTNSRLIQPDSYLVENVIGPSELRGCTFQTSSDSVNYRLIIHISSTTSSAFSLQFDGIEISKEIVPYGTSHTDWQSYTPSVTAISGTLTNFTVQGFWRRKGDSADYKIRLVFIGAVGTWSNPLFSLPSGHVIDDAKIPGGSIGGYSDENWGTAWDTGTQGYKSAARPYTTTTLIMQQLFVSGSTVVLNSYSQASPFTWTSGDEMEFTVKNVPIVGWSSSTVVSSSAETRVVALNAIKTSGSHTSSGNYQDITSWGVSTVDTHGAFNTTTGVWTCQIPGTYKVSVDVLWVPSTGGNIRAVDVKKNTSTSIAQADSLPSSTSASGCSASVIHKFVAGDTVKLLAYQNTGGSLGYSTLTGGTNFSIELLQGPSQIAASEVIAARYIAPSSGSFSAETTIVYPSKSFDTHSSYNSTTGVFTAPARGIYSFTAGLLSNSHLSSTTGAIQLGFRKNGGSFNRIGWTVGNGATTNFHVNGGDSIELNAGETLEIRAISTATITPANGYFSIHRLGGVG